VEVGKRGVKKIFEHTYQILHKLAVRIRRR